MKRSRKIIIISFIIILSISIVISPLLSFAKGNKIGLLANYYEELEVELTKGTFEPLLIIDDNEAFSKITPTVIVYNNPNGFEKQVNLIMTINKNSTINYNNLVVSVNDNILHLSDLIIDYDEFYYYFNLGTKSITAYSKNQDYIRIWVKKDTLGLTEESEITFNFLTKD